MGANAQTSVPTFTAGQVLTAQQQNWINTGVPVFADTTARTNAFGGSGEKTLAEGQFAYMEDNNRVVVYDGTNWIPFDTAPVAFTPTWGNVTIGNGGSTGTYSVVGGLVFVKASLTRGSTTTISGAITMTLPVNASSGMPGYASGHVRIIDVGTNVFYGTVAIASTTSAEFLLYRTDGVYATQTQVTGTEPMTWATGDYMNVTMWYER